MAVTIKFSLRTISTNGEIVVKTTDSTIDSEAVKEVSNNTNMILEDNKILTLVGG